MALGVGLAAVAQSVLGLVGLLTWAVALGAAAANLGLLPRSAAPGLRFATRRLLRLGVALLGLSLPIGSLAALGYPVIGLVVTTLGGTLVLTTWLGRRMGLGSARSLLIGTGFAICGAAAIAAMEETADADEEDVTVAVAMVTLCGTVAMVALPLLQVPLGLSAEQLGVWAGAGVHEVGQVVAAAGPAGAVAVSLAVAVKLTRVLLLAPVVVGVGLLRHRRSATATRRPPLVPLFVVAFVGCVALRSTGLLPGGLLAAVEVLQSATLAAALFGMGTAVRLRDLYRSSAGALALSAVSTLVVAGLSLAGVCLLV